MDAGRSILSDAGGITDRRGSCDRVSNRQPRCEAIGNQPGLLPSDIPEAQPGSAGQRRSPLLTLARTRGREGKVHRGTIEKHREDFMRKTLWLTAVAALALVGQSGP